MNIIDKILVRLPFSEVTIRTTINSSSVIERVEQGLKPFFIKRQKGQFFTFDGSYNGNYFVLQGHLRNSNGDDAFPNTSYLGIAFIRIPVKIETSPTFYGSVFDDGDNGAIIKGHFGVPFPIFALICVLVLLGVAKFYPEWSELLIGFSIFLIIWSIMSLIEFATERKGIINFLEGLFYDVIKTK
jgi:hypothetical protein